MTTIIRRIKMPICYLLFQIYDIKKLSFIVFLHVSTPDGRLPPWCARADTEAGGGCACARWRGCSAASAAAIRSCSELECGSARRPCAPPPQPPPPPAPLPRAPRRPVTLRAAASHACSSCSTSSRSSCNEHKY